METLGEEKKHREESKLEEAVQPSCAPPSGALLARSGERIALMVGRMNHPDKVFGRTRPTQSTQK
jgi:hypothetical protein